jgi:hypothetical protein
MYHGADAIRRKAPTSQAFVAAMTAALAAGVAANPHPAGPPRR